MDIRERVCDPVEKMYMIVYKTMKQLIRENKWKIVNQCENWMGWVYHNHVIWKGVKVEWTEAEKSVLKYDTKALLVIFDVVVPTD